MTDPTPDPGYREYARGACGCGVPRPAGRQFHETGHCGCRWHDPQLCPRCLDRADRQAAEAWLVDNRPDLDTLLPALETYLAAVAEHGPLD
jgi:hypothetical protein